MFHRKAFALAVAVTVAFTVAACGGHTDAGHGGAAAPVPADADFNAADVAFAQGMIVHHGQAVEMADMALANSTDPEVLALARDIKAAQEPEIAQMAAWLNGWGQPVPDPTADHATMDHGGMPMDGMIGEDKMEELQRSRGEEFDALFLAAMIEHHRGAIVMGDYELTNGRYPPLQSLADDIRWAQSLEIAELETLLGR